MRFLTRNVELGPALRLSPFRKVALGTWRTAGDPSVYGRLDIQAQPALDWLERIRGRTGERVTLTHLVAKAVARCLHLHPELNGFIRWGRIYPRRSVDIFFQVASGEKGGELSGKVIRHVEDKSIGAIARELSQGVQIIREQDDPDFRRMKQTMKKLPGWLTRSILGITGFIMYSLNLWMPIFGTPRDPFGSLMLTNIGSLGLDEAFAPLVPFSRVPVVVALGAVRDAPIVRNGQVVAAKVFSLCVTFDHRIIDGAHASHMSRTLQKILAHPAVELAE